jgi:hypothetical protein
MQETMPGEQGLPTVDFEESKPTSSLKMNGQVNFPNLETRAEKLARKRRARDMFYRSQPEPLVLANISKNHMDYGMSPAEHLRAKAERLA